MSKLEQIKALKNGNGIRYLIDEGFKILKNPINIFDVDYNLIAHADADADDPLWNELVTTGTFSIESQIFFMNECFTDAVANSEKKLVVMKSAKLKYDRILGHILNGHGIKVANILMLECNEPFNQDELYAFETLADLVTNEIRDDEFYITYGETYQNAWIKKLIDYDIEEKGLYSPHIQILYDGFKAHLHLAVVNIEQNSSRHNGHKYFVDLLRQKRNDFKYSIYDNYIIMIISTNYKTFNVKRELSGLSEYFEQENILVGVSSSFHNLFELRKYYAEAVHALNSISLDKKQCISIFKKAQTKRTQ